jgi:hypothetical protein
MNISRRITDLWAKLLGVAMTLLLPAVTLAASVEEQEAGEARLEGYANSVRLADPGSTAPYWLLLVGLGIVALIVLFKDAKRTHLD